MSYQGVPRIKRLSSVLDCLRTLHGFNSQQHHSISTSASHKSPLSYATSYPPIHSNRAHYNATSLSKISQTQYASRLNATIITTQPRRNLSTGEKNSAPTSEDAKDATPTSSETREVESEIEPGHEVEPQSKPDAPQPPKPKNKTQWPAWRIQKESLKTKFEEGWAPRRRLSPDAMEGVRELHEKDPVKFSTPVLAQEFKVSAEAIRRILKSKWRPSEREAVDRRGRWERRETRIWNHMVEVGLRPERIEDPETGVKKLKRRPVVKRVKRAWSKKP